jgi:hypothetical protein
MGDMVEYDTGVVFFDKSWATGDDQAGTFFSSDLVFRAWNKEFNLDSASHFHAAEGIALMPVNDQAGFALAVDSTGFNPFVLPLNWNLHPRWQKTLFGPLKVWHDYGNPPPAIDQWNEQQGAVGAVNVCGEIGQ